MNKKTLVIVSIVVGIFLVGAGALAYTSDQNKKKDAAKGEMMKNGINKIKELEYKIKKQQTEIDKLNKKAKRSSFWLFWLLSKSEK